MRKVSIITCFTYRMNPRHLFNTEYLASDLRRVVLFAINSINCNPEDLYVLTDLPRSDSVRTELLGRFKSSVREKLLEQGVPKTLIARMEKDSRRYEDTPSIWLKSMSRTGELPVGSLLPEITPDNVVETVSLFCNLIFVSGEKSYTTALSSVLKKEMTHLFFYYSGHGVSVPLVNRNQRSSLLVPRGESVDSLSKERFQELIRPTLERVNALMIFDCCHSSSFVDLQFTVTFSPREVKQNEYARRFLPEIICITSATDEQTCGFYNSKHSKGSLFTYYLFRFLKSSNESVRICSLEENVEEKIVNYRRERYKPEQHITVSLTDLSVRTFPSWLFK